LPGGVPLYRALDDVFHNCSPGVNFMQHQFESWKSLEGATIGDNSYWATSYSAPLEEFANPLRASTILRIWTPEQAVLQDPVKALVLMDPFVQNQQREVVLHRDTRYFVKSVSRPERYVDPHGVVRHNMIFVDLIIQP
jgi:hypothetical protein